MLYEIVIRLLFCFDFIDDQIQDLSFLSRLQSDFELKQNWLDHTSASVRLCP